MFYKHNCFFFPTTFVPACLRSTEVGEKMLEYVGLPTQAEWGEFLREVDDAILIAGDHATEEDLLYYLGRSHCNHQWYSPNPLIDLQARCTLCGAMEE